MLIALCLAAAEVASVASAVCLSEGSYRNVVIHVRRLNKNVVFNVPNRYEIKIFGDESFIVNFSYPGFEPRPIDASIVEPAARLIVYGNSVGEGLASAALRYAPTHYQRTANGIDIFTGSLNPGGATDTYYSFKDAEANPALFHDIGDMAVGYFYNRRLPSGVDVKGVVGKKVGSSFRNVDNNLASFIQSLICDKE